MKIKIDQFSNNYFRNISNINSVNFVKMVYSNSKDKRKNDMKSVDTMCSVQSFKTEDLVDRLKSFKKDHNRINSNYLLYSGNHIHNRSLEYY
jgi:hypothetical protein